MPNIPVDLPDHLMQFVDQGAKQGEYANASEFIVALVAAANEKQWEFEAALIAGLSSGSAEVWTDEEWQAIKKTCRREERKLGERIEANYSTSQSGRGR